MEFWTIRKRLLTAGVILFLQIDRTNAQDAVLTVIEPQAREAVVPSYPMLLLEQGQEGLVYMNFMVDTEGRVFDPAVMYSTGSPRFHQIAVNALLETQFTPATVNGEPTVGSGTYAYHFRIEDNIGARENFIRAYRRFATALDTGDQEKAGKALAALRNAKVQNHYEHAYLYLAEYQFVSRYGSVYDQMYKLHGALSFASTMKDRIYLPEDSQTAAFRQLFGLQLANNRLREAMATFLLMEQRGDKEGVDTLRSAYERLQALEHSDDSYGIEATMDERGMFFLGIHKHHFYVDEVVGKLDEFKLRCSNHYVGFPAEARVSYEVPESWGTCSLQVIAEPDAQFVLIQH